MEWNDGGHSFNTNYIYIHAFHRNRFNRFNSKVQAVVSKMSTITTCKNISCHSVEQRLMSMDILIRATYRDRSVSTAQDMI